MNLPTNAQALLVSTALATAGWFAPGCTTTVHRPRPPEVKVETPESARVLDDRAAVRARLQSRFREGMKLFREGKGEQALAVLQQVHAEAVAAGITLGHEFDAPLSQVLTTEPAPPPPSPPPPPIPEPPLAAPPPPPPDAVDEMHVRLPALSEPGMADRPISVNFNEVDIRVVLKTISDVTGVNFLVNEQVKGTVTLISPTPIRLGELYSVLESILEIRGFAAVPSGPVVKIVPRAEASKRNVLTRVGADPEAIPRNDSIVTQIIPLRHADVTEISGIVTPLVSPGAHVATHAQTNSLMITDASANIYHIAVILRQLDVPGREATVAVIGLKHASAADMARQVLDLLEGARTAPAGRGPAPSAASSLKILPDTRTNALIVRAPPAEMAHVRTLVKDLDVERSVDQGNLHVVYLKHAQAEEMVKSVTTAVDKTLKKDAGTAVSAIQITADSSTNALIVVAPPQEFRMISDVIAKLDIPREQVLVEMRVLEVTEEALREIGFDWSTLDAASSSSLRGFGATNLGPRVEAATGNLEGLGVGVWKNVGGVVQIGAIMKALEQTSGVNILSTPHILTSNHQEASIKVAENIPYVKDTRITESDPATPTAIKTFDYKDVGIELKITPHVSQGGMVRLAIASKFSKLIEGAAGTSADTPTTAVREANTVIAMPSGSTVVIGGLIRDDKITTEKAVPLVSRIPGIGRLFKVRRAVTQKTNLLLFITPHVLGYAEDMARTAAAGGGPVATP